MAEMVFAFASSHGPQLSLTPDKWELRADLDRTRRHFYRGETFSFDDLLEKRRTSHISELNLMENRVAHYERSQQALDTLAAALAEVKPDVLIVIGDDQDEWFDGTIQPALAVLCGTDVVNRAYDPDQYSGASGMATAAKGWRPPEDQAYVIEQSLAECLVEQSIDEAFDVTVCKKSPRDEKGPLCITHSVGFIVRRLMADKPVPVVPILQNTFYGPNRVKPGRAYEFGRMLARGIKAWGRENAGKRVAVCASGGLSHYVVDEEWDLKMLHAMRDGDVDTLFNEPNIMFQSGTSETKNWIAVAGLAAEAGKRMTIVDYVPCYRTEAGTGNAMGFAVWR